MEENAHKGKIMREQFNELSTSVGNDAEGANAVNVDPETGEIIEPLN